MVDQPLTKYVIPLLNKANYYHTVLVFNLVNQIKMKIKNVTFNVSYRVVFASGFDHS